MRNAWRLLETLRGLGVLPREHDDEEDIATPSAAANRIWKEKPDGYEVLFLTQLLDDEIAASPLHRDQARFGFCESTLALTADNFGWVLQDLMQSFEGVMKSVEGMTRMIAAALADPKVLSDT